MLYSVGVVVQCSAAGGHYVAFAHNDSLKSWFEFNDTRVHSVSVDTVQSSEGYVLFYRKVSSPSSRSWDLIDLVSNIM